MISKQTSAVCPANLPKTALKQNLVVIIIAAILAAAFLLPAIRVRFVAMLISVLASPNHPLFA